MIEKPVRTYRYTDRVTGEEKVFVPDAGWDHNPGKVAWRPDPGRWSKEIAEQFRQRGTFTPYDPEFAAIEPDTSTALTAAVVMFENEHRADGRMEHGATFDKAGVKSNEKEGLHDRVTYMHDQLKTFAGRVFTHNHPGGGSFSVDDIAIAAEYNFAEIRAVTELFRHSMSGRWPSPGDVRRVFDEEYPRAENEVREMVRSGDLRILHYGAEVLHRAWARVASRLGLTYIREKS